MATRMGGGLPANQHLPDRAYVSTVQWLAGALAAGSILWALLDPRFRNTEGYLTGAFALPLSVGFAFLLAGWAVRRQAPGLAFWCGLLVVGQGVSLQLIDAGPLVGYQHYLPADRLLREVPRPILALLVFQTVVVVWGFRGLLSNLISWSRRCFKWWQLAGIGLVFGLTSATVSRVPVTYIVELGFATFVQALNLATLVLALRAVPTKLLSSWGSAVDRLFGADSDPANPRQYRWDPVALAGAGFVTLSAVALSILVYGRHPHLPDEVVYLYHAGYFARGWLTMPLPPVPEAFSIDLMYYGPDRWFSPVPPGWPAVLALGTLTRVPWLVNPLLAGLCVLLGHAFILDLYDRRTARMTVLLMATSPWHVFLAMSFMNHTIALTCALAAAVAVTRLRRRRRLGWGLLGGCAIGMLSLIRPLEGLAVAALLGVWVLMWKGVRFKISSVVALGVGAIGIGAITLFYNFALTGNPAYFPISAYADKYYGPNVNALGFGPERGTGWTGLDPFPGHGPLDVLVNTNLNAFSLNVELLGWSTGSLILVAMLAFSGAMRRTDLGMLAAIGVIIGIHGLYWFGGGPDFGARYWYLILVPCLVMTVRGLQVLAEKLDAGTESTMGVGRRAFIGAVMLCALSVVNYFPWRAVDKYHHYRGMRPDVRALAAKHAFGRAVVLIRGNRFPDYASAAVYNSIDLQADDPLYVWDRNPEVRSQVLDAYPDRTVWIVEGPSVTNRGYQVVAGPITSRELMEPSVERR